MDESSKSKRGETREFWEEAIRLWAESGLSVREFCNREGLAEHTFYSWRRELMPESPASEVIQEPSATEGSEAPADGRRRRRRKPIANSAGTSTSAVEFLAAVGNPTNPSFNGRWPRAASQ
jgi:transposase-like protein